MDEQQYLCTVYVDQAVFSAMSPAEFHDMGLDVLRLRGELIRSGQLIASAPLRPVETAASVRIRGGQVIVTDGPFAETKEQLAGFFMIETATRDEAIDIASRIPQARIGTVEVRQIIEQCEVRQILQAMNPNEKIPNEE